MKNLEQESKPIPKPIPIDTAQFANLSDGERKIRGLSKEVQLIFLETNKPPIVAFQGGSKRVSYDFPKNVTPKLLTSTHNHPNIYWGGTFSQQDIISLSQNPAIGMKRVVGRKIEGTYIAIATDKADYDGLLKQILEDEIMLEVKSYKRSMLALGEFWQDEKPTDDQDKIARQSKRSRQEGTGVLVTYYKKILPEYGFVYVRDKKGR
ncbi:MAG: hypothetical protein FWG65_10640 [Turicibacter sp.]|nr:hypothetical protein [Turicibacter sp.]